MGHLGDLVLNDGTDTSLDVVEHILLFSTSKTFLSASLTHQHNKLDRLTPLNYF